MSSLASFSQIGSSFAGLKYIRRLLNILDAIRTLYSLKLEVITFLGYLEHEYCFLIIFSGGENG
jgi:hypothetical protein